MLLSDTSINGILAMKEKYNNVTTPKDEVDRQLLDSNCLDECCCGCCEVLVI